MITTKIYSSLTSVRPEGCEDFELKEYSLCKNEAFSFQMAYKITDNSTQDIPFFVRVTSPLPINNYYVNVVPVIHTDYSVIEPKQSIGMYPDILVPKATNPEILKREAWGDYKYTEAGESVKLFAYNDSWQAVWFTVNEDGVCLPSGKHTVKLELYSQKMEKVGGNELTLEVLDQALPQQSFIYTNWFHYDCLADYYNVEIFSDRFFEIMGDFVRKAVRNGMNMLLLPCFTPPLDTPVGEERMTAQLVKVKVENGRYIFDFSLLKRFTDMCRRNGIKYFEHSHFFTQWGAKHAPKIMAEANGESVRLFGWDTDALSDQYIGFLRAYLTELKVFLKAEKLEKNILFHISDEPNKNNYKNYEKAYGKIADLLQGYMVGDALSDPEYYESGLVKLPIAATSSVHKFVGKGENIWCYYTGQEIKEKMSNRLIQISPERNRSLGFKMYYYNMKGFLHWGYNYYYGELSGGSFNPFMNPCGGYPNAGTSYCVYPANDGTAYQSVRQKVFGDGLTDIRALQLLESLSDRTVCEEIIKEYFGVPDFFKMPDTPNILLKFRNEINKKIKYYSELKGR